MSDDLPPDETLQAWPDEARTFAAAVADKAAQSPPACEPDQCLPDGLGLSVEDVRALLAKKHDLAVPKDDPLLMMVTILNAFLGAQSQLQKKHEKALSAFMGEQTTAYVQGVEKSVADLTDTLSHMTSKGIQEAASGFAASLAGFRTSLFLCTAIIGLSALLNVAVFVLQAVRHG